jgi:hypothetical protein
MTVAVWSFGKDPDVMIEVWSTAALIGAVIVALLEDPEKLQLAMRVLGASKNRVSRFGPDRD